MLAEIKFRGAQISLLKCICINGLYKISIMKNTVETTPILLLITIEEKIYQAAVIKTNIRIKV